MAGIDETVGVTPDTTAPQIALQTPPDGSVYTLGQVVAASYACTDTGGPVATTTSSPGASTTVPNTSPRTTTSISAQSAPAPSVTNGASPAATCVGSVPQGDAIDTLTPGTHVFTVDASDAAGNTASQSASYTVRAGDASQGVNGGDIVTTDPGGIGASVAVPVQTQLAVPVGVSGQITVTPQPAGPSPAGYVLFGTQIDLTGPAAPSAAAPYVATFAIDASALAGISPDDVQVFRNGVAVADCTDASAAIPDPCVAARGPVPDASGDAFITVRTTQFSAWTVGRRVIGVDSASPSSRGRCHSSVDLDQRSRLRERVGRCDSGWWRVRELDDVGRREPLARRRLDHGRRAAGSARRPSDEPRCRRPDRNVLEMLHGEPAAGNRVGEPQRRAQGTANQLVTITGSNLTPGAVVAISGSGVDVNAVSGGGSTLSLDVSVSDTAAPGARDVAVTNPEGGAVTKMGAFTVNAKPAVTSAAPGALAPGAAATVTI